ncbi:O-antigen ligase family protein [Blastococcus sp. SYSU D00820]
MQTPSARLTAYLALAAAALAAAAAVVLIAMPTLLAASLVLVALATLIAKPSLSVYASIALGLATLPAAIPTAIHPGPYTIYLFEIPLAIAAAYTAVRVRPGTGRRVAAAIAILCVTYIVGLVTETDQIRRVAEFQSLLDLVTALYVASGIRKWGIHKQVQRVVAGVLLWSAAMVLLAALGVIDVGGRTETAHLGDQAFEATRLLTNTQFLALAVAVGCLVRVVTGRENFGALSLFAAPSLVILLLSFSRNTLLGLLVAIAVAVAFSGHRVRKIVRGVTGLIAAATLVWVVAWLSQGTAFAAWLAEQGRAYKERVFGGLTDGGLQFDPSAGARRRETTNLLNHLSDQPLTGHGLGYAYQPAFGSGFDATLGPYYAHNFWLWLLVKAGFPLAIGFALAISGPLLNRHAWNSRAAVAAAAASAALLIICFVAPLPLDNWNSLALGLTLGVLAGEVQHGRQGKLRSVRGASSGSGCVEGFGPVGGIKMQRG